MAVADVLMITYNRPQYVRVALPHLLENCLRDDARLWLWHNGDDVETLALVRASLEHPAVHRFHHSPKNVGLNTPTNWVWTEGDSEYVSKVDDDCLNDEGWIEKIARAQDANPEFGAIGTWRFYDEDFRSDLATKKIRTFAAGYQIMQNLSVQGSGYLLKRRWVERFGLLQDGQTFPQYCKQIARHGCVNGWMFPFVHEEHMDDPRSPYTCLRTEADLAAFLPLSAKKKGITTLAEWTDQQREWAYDAQADPIDPRTLVGWRKRIRGAQRRLAGKR